MTRNCMSSKIAGIFIWQIPLSHHVFDRNISILNLYSSALCCSGNVTQRHRPCFATSSVLKRDEVVVGEETVDR